MPVPRGRSRGSALGADEAALGQHIPRPLLTPRHERLHAKGVWMAVGGPPGSSCTGQRRIWGRGWYKGCFLGSRGSWGGF